MEEILKFEDLLGLIEGMRVVDLTHTIEERMPVYPTHPQYFHLEWNTGDPANMYQLLISEHAGTHLDCPAHFYGDRADARHVPLDEVPVERFIGRAVVLDFRGYPSDQELTAADIQKWEAANHPLHENQAVIFRFGWDRKWALLPEGKPYLESWPGIDRAAAEYLAERRVRLVGTDCLGIDGSATVDLGSHFALLERGVLIVENLKNLDQVPSPFLLITLPLKLKEGTGSPIRAVGLFY
jgi:kynurenine formamidase